ncbi:MAG: Formamidopyrimidine-DNA glycolase [Bacteroidota bacterium]|nr:Formamidopyrimidine-DNA glycolase [Bacteroidota bacterium]
MPEGPSIVILKEELLRFRGKKIREVSGNAKIDLQRLKGKKITDIRSWGKHFLISFDNFFIRIHLLMFGRHLVNDRKDAAPRLSMKFSKDEVNFYSCSVKLFDGDISEVYDWRKDTMSEEWSPSIALKALRKDKKRMICDGLMDQEIFAGVGNIIKNEALFITRVHPEALIGNIPLKKLKEIVHVTREYCFDFYRWKKIFELKKHFLIYNKRNCAECGRKLSRKPTGKGERRSFFCINCQARYKTK